MPCLLRYRRPIFTRKLRPPEKSLHKMEALGSAQIHNNLVDGMTLTRTRRKTLLPRASRRISQPLFKKFLEPLHRRPSHKHSSRSPDEYGKRYHFLAGVSPCFF